MINKIHNPYLRPEPQEGQKQTELQDNAKTGKKPGLINKDELKLHNIWWTLLAVIFAFLTITIAFIVINGLSEGGAIIGFEVFDWVDDVLKHPFSRRSFESFLKLVFTAVFVGLSLVAITNKKR